MFNHADVLQQKPGPSRGHWYVLAAMAATLAVSLLVVQSCGTVPEPPPPLVPPVVLKVPPATPPHAPVFRSMVYPTPQTNLLEADGLGCLQPTASGRPESGAYGDVRPGKFHEGIDIAPTKRDRAGRPLDPVGAVANGTVGHINRIAGNSNYGTYVVLIHNDELGDIYTLYAHLAKVTPGLYVGQQVEAGTVLGTMGHTPVNIIPAARGHLHFEIGLISNARFREWFRGRRLKPDHGVYNGWNLMAIDPIAVFATHKRDPCFRFLDHLRSLPRAFDVALATPKQLDFFRRYPKLWEGPEFIPGAVVIECAANGVPISGRNAGDEEKLLLAGNRAVVLRASDTANEGTGAHLVYPNGKGGWKFGGHSQLWLEILTY